MDRLAWVEGMLNHRLPPHWSVGPGVTFGQSAFRMQPASAYANTPPLMQLTSQVEVAKVMALVGGLKAELKVVKSDLARFKKESDSTQVKISI